MENPICFSRYFTNKQNVRSIGNVLNLKFLKKTNREEFLLHILEDKILVDEVPSEFSDILFAIKMNIRKNSKQDFKNYFNKPNEMCKIHMNMVPVNKEEIFIGCWKALYETIPNKLFGNRNNIKLFKELVEVVVLSMKNQHIFLPKFIHKWDVKIYPWNVLPPSTVNQVLTKTIFWILKNVLMAIICLNFFVTSCKIDVNENKLHFFWKNQWQSFYDKSISNMITSKMISRYEPKCLGKKIKITYSLQERLHLKFAKREIPKLHLVLKPNKNYRPIVRYKNDVMTSAEKYKIKERLNFLKLLNGKPQKKIETKFALLHSVWMNLNQPKLYFVKTDLSNAFGSINREKLMKILAERNMEFQKTQQPLHLKKKYAQIYREITMELRKPLLVRAGSTVYEWKEGLVQGYKYSPALSELYYTRMDEIYFTDHLKMNDSELKLFVRAVDDYLYITDSLEDAESFLSALSNYRNVNSEKTVANFQHSMAKCSNEITFLGYTYNTKSLEVCRASYIYTGQMCYKITFSSAISDINKFLENRIGQSGIHINSHLFNFKYNNEELIWQHIFLTLCLSANKFCTILSILCNKNEMQKYLELYKKRVTVKLCNTMIETLRKSRGKDILFVYCINHFRYLSFKALSLCAKTTPKCHGLVPLINIELCRTNCIFGKFRDHASRIDKHGKSLIPAIKEVCRRMDLRKIMKQFEVLPEGFACYNHETLFA
ncbi:telomerase reverse transcriptase-like [Epargyreus clarus]|uniref:telomerase reverse transcriptase-like n=1 Tax=Epargyreus clarus TaxID=520877 RepID=UPI003C2D9856